MKSSDAPGALHSSSYNYLFIDDSQIVILEVAQIEFLGVRKRSFEAASEGCRFATDHYGIDQARNTRKITNLLNLIDQKFQRSLYRYR